MLENDSEAYLQSIQLHNDRIEASVVDPVYNSFVLPQQEKVRNLLWEDHIDEVWVLGGNRCLAGEQEIYDPVQQKSLRVDEIEGDFHVWAWDETTSRRVQAKALAPFRKPSLSLFEYQLGNQQRLRVSSTHLALQFGSYRPIGSSIFLDVHDKTSYFSGLPLSDGRHLVTTLDIYPSTSLGDVRRLLQTAQDSQWNYSVYLRLDDERPRHVLDGVLYDSPLLDDVLEYISYVFSEEGDSEYKSQCIRLYLQSYLPSTLDDQPQREAQSVDTESRASCKPCKSVSQSHGDREFFEAHRRSIVEFSHRLQSSVLSGSQGIRFYCISALGGNRLYYTHLVKSDFLRNDTVWDFTVPTYHNYFIGDTVHHNSGKSRSAAWMIMQTLMENPNTEVICWSQNEDASVERQQPYLWEMMPQEYKKKQKDEVAKINYSKATGFTGNKFILPNGSVCYFKFYTQFQNDDSVIEGAKLGAPKKECKFINIGTWCDEYLGDETLLKRLRSRCGDFDAKILVTFTPLRGYTPCVGSMLDGAKTVESLPASLLDGELMPYVQAPHDRDNMAIVYYHSERNPFSNWKRLARNHANASVEEIKKVLYGYPTKSMTAMFNTFDQVAHIYDPQEEHIDFANGEWTNYQVIDPAGAKSWACAWYGVNAKGDVRQWAEWPDRATYGEWAVEGKSQVRSDDAVTWKRGPAAEDCGGLSIRSLQMEWTKIEGSIPIFERIIDIRFAHSPKQTADDGERTLSDELGDIGIETVPSFGAQEDIGLAKIQEWLAFDNKQPFDKFTNSPSFRISSECGNTIFSFMNYCQNGKKDEPLKDFIDLPRYAVTHDEGTGIGHFGKDTLGVLVPSGGY